MRNYNEFDPGHVRAKIVADFTLFSKFLFELETIEDNKIPTLCTNGKWIKYNKKFMDQSNPNDQFFKYMHEVAHVFLAHHIRVRPEHIEDKAQKAADYAVNDLLKDAGLRVPLDALWSHDYSGMGYEEIYASLCKRDDRKQHDPGKHGRVESADLGDPGDDQEEDGVPDPRAESKTKAQMEKALAEHTSKQIEAIQQGKMMGNLSAEFERKLDAMVETPPDWRDLLPDMIEDIFGMEDYSYMQPDRMYIDSEFIVPGMIGEKKGVVALAGDTSRSISPLQLKGMASDIMGLISASKPEKTYVMWCDKKVHEPVQIFNENDEVVLKPKGGGGTDFRPPFRWLADNNVEPTVMIYLTDGFCNRYPDDPGYPVVWVIWQDREVITPPFGQVVVMHDLSKK